MALRTTHVCRLILLGILIQSGMHAQVRQKSPVSLPAAGSRIAVPTAVAPAGSKLAVPVFRPGSASVRPAVVLAPRSKLLSPSVRRLRAGKDGA